MYSLPPSTLKPALLGVLDKVDSFQPDVVFLLDDDKQQPAHRAVLATRMPETLKERLKEAFQEGQGTMVSVARPLEVPGAIFEQLLRFWYGGGERDARILQHDAQLYEALGSDDSYFTDLARIRQQQLFCDVTIHILRPRTPTNAKKKKLPTSPSAELPVSSGPSPPASPPMTNPAPTSNNAGIPSILNTSSSTSYAPNNRRRSSSDVVDPKQGLFGDTFAVHRFILAARSPYFASLLCDDQGDKTDDDRAHNRKEMTQLFLPVDVFTPTTADILLHFVYTDELQVPVLPNASLHPMDNKKYVLRELQKVYDVAHFLEMDSLMQAALHHMAAQCHQFECTCTVCALLLPSMLALAYKYRATPRLSAVYTKLLALYTELVHTLPVLWSQKTFALMVIELMDDHDLADGTVPANIQQLLDTRAGQQQWKVPSSMSSSSSSVPVCSSDEDKKDEKGDENDEKRETGENGEKGDKKDESYKSDKMAKKDDYRPLLVALVQGVLDNITQHNAIHVLHAFHLCLSRIRSADPLPTWSQPCLLLLHALLQHTITMVARKFDYYTVEYPILLSCVDGIGGVFSVDFLNFVLTRLMDQGMTDANATIFYQGIVRDLMGRQEMVKNVAVDGVLLDARHQCVDYIADRWTFIKATGAFQSMEKDLLRQLADDINVPYRTLTKPAGNEASMTTTTTSSLFGFKSKASASHSSGISASTSRQLTHTRSHQPSSSSAVPVEVKSSRRLSLGSLRATSRTTKHRSWLDSLTGNHSHGKLVSSSSSSLATSPTSPNDDILHEKSLSDTEPTTTTTSSQAASSSFGARRHRFRPRKEKMASMADTLLPLDLPLHTMIPLPTTSSPSHPIAGLNTSTSSNSHKSTSTTTNNTNTSPDSSTSPSTSPPSSSTHHQQQQQDGQPRKSRLTFELPETPIRARIMGPKGGARRRRRSPKKSLWSRHHSGSDSEDDDDDNSQIPVIGAKVELLHRPLPTLGRIKFIGKVHFAKGIWVGVELESRLGQNDGQAEGVRYFQTDPQRGVFVKLDGLRMISTK
ncbi:hypothetical protein BC940DRAFT_265839 [Gongronella butleri]|nr:hypothetical protein BC940DRAFT_265839 [Gongronella butleri]